MSEILIVNETPKILIDDDDKDRAERDVCRLCNQDLAAVICCDVTSLSRGQNDVSELPIARLIDDASVDVIQINNVFFCDDQNYFVSLNFKFEKSPLLFTGKV